MFYWIYDIPTWSLVAIFSSFAVAVTCLGAVFLRPPLRRFFGDHPGRNELLGFFVSTHGVYYGILLGLLAVAAFEQYSKVEENVTLEAANLATVFRDASAYPEPHRTRILLLLGEYTRYVIENAWPANQRGIVPTDGDSHVAAIHAAFSSFVPSNPAQEIIHAEAYSRLNELIRLRRVRLMSVTGGIPVLLWYVVAVGAILNTVMIWLFDTNLRTQLVLGGLISFFLATVIALVAAMDHPFRGEVSVSSEPFQQVYRTYLEARRAALDHRGSPPIDLPRRRP